MIEAGLTVTLNTDVPDVTGQGLADEYALVRETYGASDVELAALAGASVEASFASHRARGQALARIAEWAAVRAPSADG
jgi:adenosine deaminase